MTRSWSGGFTFWSRTAMPDQDSMSIGEVINLLRDDFPDVSVSKIRFLESQGLIDPGRSDSGYRQFDGKDLARLRFILQQQRDHFLPLKVIKSKLTLWERGEDSIAARQPEPRHSEDSGAPLGRDEVLKRSGLSSGQLDESGVSRGHAANRRFGRLPDRVRGRRPRSEAADGSGPGGASSEVDPTIGRSRGGSPSSADCPADACQQCGGAGQGQETFSSSARARCRQCTGRCSRES